MNVGDLVKFKKTGTVGLIVKYTGPQNEHEGSVEVYISDGQPVPHEANGFTWMSYAMLKRSAKVVK